MKEKGIEKFKDMLREAITLEGALCKIYLLVVESQLYMACF